MKIKIEKRVSLTPRDLFLLMKLYQNVVLSYCQLWRKAFQGKAKSTVLNRLGKLEGMGFIERWRVPVLNSKQSGPGIFVVFSITRKGLAALSVRHPGQMFRQKPIRVHGYGVYHDVLLVDVMEALRVKFTGATVTNGRLWGEQSSASAVNPDAVLESPCGKERWAVELECTAKSEKRYREIVLRYRLQSAFDRVLYVTDKAEVVQKLARVLDRKPSVLGAEAPTEKFLVVPLRDLVPKSKTNQNEREIHE